MVATGCIVSTALIYNRLLSTQTIKTDELIDRCDNLEPSENGASDSRQSRTIATDPALREGLQPCVLRLLLQAAFSAPKERLC